eukprot:TRINITY_DN11122_c0_g1_i2.p1 TRINITY_DN11122_c0_g1~~TRINITY_DN11122_c0_g1_i2.p1  ORF type:complete len:294 (+),score=40.82 TRINITY_DN11122_c0_g1_i2:64-945(+)
MCIRDSFQYIFKKPLPPRIARALFLQIFEGVSYLHSIGVAHADLRQKSILLNSKFCVKIADFDFSVRVREKSDSRLVLGPNEWRAPEIIYSRTFHGEKTDVFALGCALFYLVNGRSPVAFRADSSDRYYGCFFAGSADNFWARHTEAVRGGDCEPIFSKDFRDLINGMLALEPGRRLSMKDIRESLWLIEDVAEMEEVVEELKARIRAFQRRAARAVPTQSEAAVAQLQGNVFRGWNAVRRGAQGNLENFNNFNNLNNRRLGGDAIEAGEAEEEEDEFDDDTEGTERMVRHRT